MVNTTYLHGSKQKLEGHCSQLCVYEVKINLANLIDLLNITVITKINLYIILWLSFHLTLEHKHSLIQNKNEKWKLNLNVLLSCW